ncbi:MAG: MYXO-CTERM sorting domain-containing protein [Opitutus sp.]|nr:MYXO-CTERM sorting domain-containing protein [Opitutus sp.]
MTANTYAHLLITRESTGETSGNLSVYLNGELMSFGDDDFLVDSAGYFLISNALYFGLDDRGRSEYASNGGFANLQLWNYVLSDSEIEDVVSDIVAIPEPSTTAVLAGLAGLGAVLIYRRRR